MEPSNLLVRPKSDYSQRLVEDIKSQAATKQGKSSESLLDEFSRILDNIAVRLSEQADFTSFHKPEDFALRQRIEKPEPKKDEFQERVEVQAEDDNSTNEVDETEEPLAVESEEQQELELEEAETEEEGQEAELEGEEQEQEEVLADQPKHESTQT